jgi:hypothetical protein
METSSLSLTTVSSGGFRIETRLDELVVTADRKAFASKKKSVLNLLMKCFAFVFLGLWVIFVFVQKMLAFDFTGYLISTFFIAAIFLVGWLGEIRNIRCTRENMEVIRVRRGRADRSSIYPKPTVKGIRFGLVSSVISKYPVCGIIFTAEGKKVKTLDGLKVVEA